MLMPKLERNFSLMFWIQALTEVKVINVISTLFLLSRGLTLSQIVYSGIVFSVITLLFEVPSSYLADKWGRKNLMILSVLTSLIYWFINIFARGWWLIVAIGVYALSSALMSGTDEALIYDTSKELGKEENSLKKLGQYFSSQRIFKMIMPLIAVLIAKDLSNWQYILILLIDVVANIVALFLCFFLKEPRHYFDVEKMEVGVMRDALKMFNNNRYLLKSMMNKSLMFISTFLIWRVSSEYFLSIGMSVLMVGITTAIMQTMIFVVNQKINKIMSGCSEIMRINFFNYLVVLSLAIFFINEIFLRNIPVALCMYIVFNVAQVATWPLFSQLFNEVGKSYNRATTLSLANLTKSVLDIPLLFLGSLLINLGYKYLFGMCLVIDLVVILFLGADSGARSGITTSNRSGGNT